MKHFLVLALLIFKSVSAQVIVDESYKDKSFLKFKNKLTSCIKAKDTTQLKELLAERILESSDSGEKGCSKDAFIKMYFKNKKPAYKNYVWNEMERIVRFGFYQFQDTFLDIPISHDATVYTAPSYLKQINPDEAVVILDNRVNLREKPSLSAKVIRQSSFEVFACDCSVVTMTESTFITADNIDWIEIKLKHHKKAYVAAKYTSYTLEKKLVIAKVNGEWKIIQYYSGPGC